MNEKFSIARKGKRKMKYTDLAPGMVVKYYNDLQLIISVNRNEMVQNFGMQIVVRYLRLSTGNLCIRFDSPDNWNRRCAMD